MEIKDILEFYQDKSNYSIKNGVIPVMIDGGDIARSYQPPKPKVTVPAVTKTKVKPVKAKKGKKVVIDDDELSYLPKRKTERREENTSMDLVTTKCSKCNAPTTARQFELNNEFASVVCKNCLKRK